MKKLNIVNKKAKDVVFLSLSLLSLILSYIKISVKFDFAWIAVILCGLPIVAQAVVGFITEFDVKSDFLVSVAVVASLILGEVFAAGEIVFIMTIGEVLEDFTVSKAKNSVQALMKLVPKTARVIVNGEEKLLPVSMVNPSDVLRIIPGDVIPLDGIVCKGGSAVDEKSLTGETVPVDKTEGDSVMSGSVNMFGSFEMIVTKKEADSSVQKIIAMVQNVDAGGSSIVRTADKWATFIVAVAFFCSVLTYLFTKDINRAVTILVVFCPCAFVLATPTAVVAAIGKASEYGFIVKDGSALERLARVKHILFDKTGTLTYGELQVSNIVSERSEISADELFGYVVAVEQYSEHPIGRAITASYKFREKHIESVLDFTILPGKGVRATVRGKDIKVGNEKLVESSVSGVNGTVVYVSIDGVYSGYVVLKDRIKEKAKDVISQLKEMGISSVLVTGDNKERANDVASAVGIEEVHASCLPSDKTDVVNEKKTYGPVCMVGDGVNDAAGLKASDVGIAMAGIGSDVAMENADIALTDDDITRLPVLIRLSGQTVKVIRANIIAAMVLNFTAVVLAVLGVMGPVFGALVHNIGSVLVIISSIIFVK